MIRQSDANLALFDRWSFLKPPRLLTWTQTPYLLILVIWVLKYSFWKFRFAVTSKPELWSFGVSKCLKLIEIKIEIKENLKYMSSNKFNIKWYNFVCILSKLLLIYSLCFKNVLKPKKLLWRYSCKNKTIFCNCNQQFTLL